MHEAVNIDEKPVLHMTLGVEVDSSFMLEGILHGVVYTFFREPLPITVTCGSGEDVCLSDSSTGMNTVRSDQLLYQVALHNSVRAAATRCHELRKAFMWKRDMEVDPKNLSELFERCDSISYRGSVELNPLLLETLSLLGLSTSELQRTHRGDVLPEVYLEYKAAVSDAFDRLVPVASNILTVHAEASLERWKTRNKVKTSA